MPTFTYRCRAGHETDHFFTPGRRRTETAKCGSCTRRARVSLAATYRGGGLTLRPEFPMMGVQSSAFEEPVQSYQHLKRLQKQHGTQDWHPVETTPAKVLEERRKVRFMAAKRKAREAA